MSMDKFQEEALEWERRRKEAEREAARLRAEADRRWEERKRQELERGQRALLRARLSRAEKEVDRLKVQERLRWVATGQPPADFDKAWEARRRELAREIVATELGIAPEELVIPDDEPGASAAQDVEQGREDVRNMLRRYI